MRFPTAAIVSLTLGLAPAQELPTPVSRLLTTTCIACHNAKLKTANLDLDRLRDPKAALAERDAWELVSERLKNGSMPPQGIPRPSAAQVGEVVRWAEAHVEKLDATRQADPGRVTARRLNRAEYNNTIRDLLGVAFRPADDFPLDDSGHGFDNIGDALSVSSALMEKYLNAAGQIVRMAIVTGPAPKPVMDRYEAEKLGEARQLPVDPEGARLVRKGSLALRHLFPRHAEYDLRLNVRGRGVPKEPHSELALFLGNRSVATLHVEPGQDRRRFFDIRVTAPAGEHPISAAFVYPGPDLFVPPANDPRRGTENHLFVDSIEVRGPFVSEAAELPETHRRIFICTPAASHEQDDCARKIAANFARRAWRRPVRPEEVERLVSFVRMALKEGDTFEQGIALAVKAVLVSPHFLFRIEKDPAPGQTRALSDFELASRLSYFLWSSMPDDELLALAEKAELARPATLETQVKRMLADPKAAALAENFAGQWLELRNLANVSPDPARFPEFDTDLREAMRRETHLFFNAVLRENRSVLDFLDGRFSFLNERLARHYGIAGVEGRNFRQIALDGVQRSGILTHASVLTVTSYPTRTSPVQRGLWVLENFLASPPPVPPANVPELKEEDIGKTMTLRQQFERHRSDPACAVCHDKMDALGFGLENYDATGAWRTHDGNFPVDAAGVLPGGKPFVVPSEMKAILRADGDAFARALTGKLLTYALGRGLESYDKPELRSMGKKVASLGYRFQSMILEVVNSPAFRMKRAEAPRSQHPRS